MIKGSAATSSSSSTANSSNGSSNAGGGGGANTLRTGNFSSLLEAIKNDDKEHIAEFFRANRNLMKLDFRDTDGRTPIHYCIEYDAYACLDAILSSPASSLIDINHKDKDDWSPLHYAALFDRIECAFAWRGHNDFATMLIEKRAKLSIQSKQGMTAQQQALNSYHFTLANELGEALLTRDDDDQALLAAGGETASDELSQDILSTIQRGEIPQFDNVNVNTVRDMYGTTPLHLCALHNMVDCIVLLIERYHMAVNSLDNNGRSPLHFAAYAGKCEAIQALIVHGAFVNVGLTPIDSGNINNRQRKESGVTPLHEAAASGDLRAVTILVENHANVNARSYYGTPLHFATSAGENGHLIIKYLVQHGADARQRNEQGMTPLHVAAFHGMPECLATLIAGGGAEVNGKCEDGSTPLLKAIHGASGSEAKENNGADPNIANDQDETPLHFAGYYGLVEIVQALIGRGANLEARDKWGETPLHKCVYTNQLRALELLVSMGARMTAVNHEAETPLHIAVRKSSGECSTTLVAKGAPLNAPNKYGEAPLHYAASAGAIELAMLLLERGATPHLADAQGDIPLMVALRRGFTEISLALIRWGVQGGVSHGSQPIPTNQQQDVCMSPLVSPMLRPNNYGEHALHAAAMAGYSDCVLALLGVGAAINESECYGNTPLHGACYSGNSDLVDMMTTMGADVNRTNKDQVTPLHVAALNGHSRVVDILMSKGANCASCDRNGNTPLHCASLAGDIASITLMLSFGVVPIDVKNAQQFTPLHMAASAGHLKCARFILESGGNPNLRDISGDTPYDTAMASRHIDTAAYLKNSKPKKSLKIFGY
eukprot:gene11503-13419_t